MLPSSAPLLSHGNFNQLYINEKWWLNLSHHFFVSESQQPHLRADSVWCGTYEEQPLSQEVRHQYHISAVRYGIDEFVPCEDEVRKYEEHSSEGEKAAALEHCRHEHHAYQAGIYAYPRAYYSLRCAWRNPGEGGCEYAADAYDHNCKVSFCLVGELSVVLNLAEVSSGEIYGHEDVRKCEKAHLSDEVLT